MNNKAFTISLLMAGFAVFMVYSYITSKEAEFQTKYGTETAVVVAKKDIAELSEIHENMVEQVKKPKQFIEPGKTTSPAEVTGFIATVPIRKGEQITLNKIVAPGVKTGLSRQVTVGKRALAIPVDFANAVGKLLKPGDRVDVVATIDPPGAAKGGQISKVVLQDVPVLAVGEWVTTQAPRKIEKDDATGKDYVRNLTIDRNYGEVTLETSPNDAAQIVLLRRSGAGLDLMLRNNDDTERVNSAGMTLLDVLGPDASKIIRTPAAQR